MRTRVETPSPFFIQNPSLHLVILKQIYGLDNIAFCNYNKIMKFEFDPAKSRKNTTGRGLPFELAEAFEWETAVYYEDSRCDYGETRIVALGFLEQRLHVICFTPIADGVRIISFRKANKREVLYYEQGTLNR